MTDAGKLTVGVEVQSNDAFAEFTNAVLREVQPALAQVNRQIQDALKPDQGGVNNAFGSIGTIAAGSFIGSLGSQLASKGLAIFQDFASKGLQAVESVLKSGFDRLVSIDTAKTKLEALGRSTAEVDQIMKSALESVKGTAFGLQDAATVAATAVAAGVGPGEALTKYLKLIADTAAVARRSGEGMGVAFNEIGQILNKLTTQGYGTNEILQQISERGLPIYNNLAKRLHMTTGEVIELASKSGIAASDIRAALEETVGGAALKMGESFEGGVENVKAALSRLGEAALKPFFGPVKDGVFSLQTTIDSLTETVKQHAPEIVEAVGTIAKGFIYLGEAVAAQASIVVAEFGIMVRQLGVVIGALADSLDLIRKPLEFIPDIVLKSLSPALYELKEHGAGLSESMHNTATSMVDTGKSALGMSQDIMDLATKTLPKAGESLDSYFARLKQAAEGNLTYANSMKAMASSVAQSIDPILYAGRVMLWQSQVQQYIITQGKSTPPGPAPVFGPSIPGWTPAMSSAGSQMPADTTKPPSSGSGGKPDPGLLYPGGQLPPVNVNGVQVQVTTPSMPMGAIPGVAAAIPGVAPNMGDVLSSGFLRDVEGRHSQQQSVYTAGLIHQLFPQIPYIGGARASGTAPNTHDTGTSIDIPIDASNMGLGDQINQWLQANAQSLGVVYTIWRNVGRNVQNNPSGGAGSTWSQGGHMNHIDVHFNGGGVMAMGPQGTNITYPGQMPGMPDLSGAMPGVTTWTPPDPTQVREAQEKINRLQSELAIQEQRMREMKADASKSEVMSAEKRREELYQEIEDAKADLKDLEQGKYKQAGSRSGQAFSFDQLPFGHPLKIAAAAIMGAGGSQADAMALLGLDGGTLTGQPMPGMQMPGVSLAGAQQPQMAPVPGTPYFMPVQPSGQPMPFAAPIGQMLSGAGQPLGNVAGDVATAFFTTPLPGPMGYPGTPTAPSTDIMKLAAERNPLLLAQMAGFNVPDYTRQGGGPGAQDLTTSGGPPMDALGRIYSDTAALIDRTFTNLDAAEKARHDQVMTVLNEVRDRLGTDFVKPTTTAAVTAGIDGISSATTANIGQQMGQAAAGPIASAVASNSGGGGEGASLVNTSVGAVSGLIGGVAGLASGGAIIGPGHGTSDSILARVSNGEWVLTAQQVGALGGFKGVQAFVNRLPKFAAGGGVDVSSTVGAEFFGVGQIPILSTIVNLLVAVLLKVIGVTITARDTLLKLSNDFREYRGDFKAFDAYGRMRSDTSGIVDRTSTSEQAAADERIRILKLVLEGLFKFIVEKIIVPIAKAIGNSLLQAASGALQGAMGAAFPGGSIVGGVVGNVITSAGGAGIDIAGEIGTIMAESIFSVALQGIGEGLQSVLPGITNSIFGGGLLAMLADPLAGLLSIPFNLFGGLFGGLSTLIPGLPFDEGGVARGVGVMPKATIQPERVLSPRQTASFERLVDALSTGRGASTTTIHAPFTVIGSERGGREAHDRLLALMN